MRVFTIGFTRKSAERFFGLLERAGVRRLLDVRLNNRSQLSGFSKGQDLEYFLRAIANIEYKHIPELAPTQLILDAYKKRRGPWSEYEIAFLQLMKARCVENLFGPELFDGACLLCSEHEPDNCHRRLVLEYLQNRWGTFEIRHLM